MVWCPSLRLQYLLIFTLIVPVHSFWIWDLLRDLICVPLFFLDSCQDKSLGTIYIDFYRAYEDKSILGVVPYREHVISRARLHRQLQSLNHWYKGKLKFRKGSVLDFDDSILAVNVPEGTSSCDELVNLGDLVNPNRISALYVKAAPYGEGRIVSGCASIVDAPLGDTSRPSVAMMSSNGVSEDLEWLSPVVDSNIAGALLAHEVGHLLGFKHTAGRQFEQGYVNPYYQSACRDILGTRSVAYPTFAYGEQEIESSRYGTFSLDEWPGRSNLMNAVLSDGLFYDPLALNVFSGNYNGAFTKILECWFERSTVSS